MGTARCVRALLCWVEVDRLPTSPVARPGSQRQTYYSVPGAFCKLHKARSTAISAALRKVLCCVRRVSRRPAAVKRRLPKLVEVMFDVDAAFLGTVVARWCLTTVCSIRRQTQVVTGILKYVPQVVLNARRRSTTGWTIWNVILDFTGGLLSVVQVTDMDCLVYPVRARSIMGAVGFMGQTVPRTMCTAKVSSDK